MTAAPTMVAHEHAALARVDPALPAIAFVLPALAQGGAESVTLRLALSFRERGHRVAIVSLLQSTTALAPIAPDVIDYIYLNAGRTYGAIPRLSRCLRTWQPDIVVTAQPHVSLCVLLLRALLRAPFAVVVTEHAPFAALVANFESWQYRLLPYLVPLLYPLADALVGVSDGLTAEMRRLVPRAQRVHRIYNPIFDSAILGLAAEPAALPWPAGPNPPLILACGRLAPEKDFSTLLKAFALLRQTQPARLLILGEGPSRAALEREAAALDITEDVRLPGYVKNPFPYMRAASVVALSSRFEGFSNVLIEALACGTPIVATDVPMGPREITENGRWGRLVPAGDAPALAAALNATLAEPLPAADLRARAACFDVVSSIDAYQALFAELFRQAAA